MRAEGMGMRVATDDRVPGWVMARVMAPVVAVVSAVVVLMATDSVMVFGYP